MANSSKFKTVVENGHVYLLDYYVYSVTFSALAAAARASQNIQIEADSDFVVEKQAYFAELAGAAQTDSTRVIPLVTLAINDSGSGRNLQNQAVYVPSVMGDGQLPFVLPVPRVFVANSTINFTVENVSAATAYANLQLSLIGYKKFYMRPANK